MRVTAPLPSTPRLEMRRRLAVAWQDPVTRASEPVGVVVTDGESHPFRDLRRARHFGGCRRCSALATGNARTIPQRGLASSPSAECSQAALPQRLLGTFGLRGTLEPRDILARSQGVRRARVLVGVRTRDRGRRSPPRSLFRP